MSAMAWPSADDWRSHPMPDGLPAADPAGDVVGRLGWADLVGLPNDTHTTTWLALEADTVSCRVRLAESPWSPAEAPGERQA